MSIGEIILTWMAGQDRTLAFLARITGLDAERIIAIITGGVPPTDEEVHELAEAMDLEADDLVSTDRPAVADVHPLQCYTVREAARLLGVSPDTVRAEMKSGALRYVVVGERAHRIPHTALAWRLTW